MNLCGKGNLPECQFFTTCGCVSPFNCPYKIETGYINSATSIPAYMEQYNGMSDDDIKRLKAQTADLHEKLKETEHRAEVAERALLRLCEETMRDKLIIMYPIIGRQVRDKQELYDYCIEQAEKELAEEIEE